MIRKISALSLTAAIVLTGCGGTGNLTTPGTVTTPAVPATPVAVAPSTAIQHIVVIYGENVSFDHYFGTYPNAANTGGTTFTAATGTTSPTRTC